MSTSHVRLSTYPRISSKSGTAPAVPYPPPLRITPPLTATRFTQPQIARPTRSADRATNHVHPSTYSRISFNSGTSPPAVPHRPYSASHPYLRTILSTTPHRLAHTFRQSPHTVPTNHVHSSTYSRSSSTAEPHPSVPLFSHPYSPATRSNLPSPTRSADRAIPCPPATFGCPLIRESPSTAEPHSAVPHLRYFGSRPYSSATRYTSPPPDTMPTNRVHDFTHPPISSSSETSPGGPLSSRSASRPGSPATHSTTSHHPVLHVQADATGLLQQPVRGPCAIAPHRAR